MFNHIILSILLSLHFSACSPNTKPSNNNAVIEASNTMDTATRVSAVTTNVEKPAIESTSDSKLAESTAEPAVKQPIKEQVAVQVVPQKTAPVKPSSVEETPAPKLEEQSNKSEALVIEAVTPTPSKEVKEEKVTEEPPLINPSAPALAKPDHGNWNDLLAKYVNSKGAVNYAGFKADKTKLQAYLAELTNNPPESSWTRNEKMAFWINAYNAYTVKLIVDNYPVKSITDLKGGKPWDVKWIKIGAKTYSLNNIENDILRPQYKDARIHFAVNCAAESCPPLLNQAWTSELLDVFFNKQAKAFINNPAYNKISANKVQVSKIFDWYKEDFGNLINYLNKFSTTKINAKAKVEFLEYDWALNKQ